jgi:hypothetical protein
MQSDLERIQPAPALRCGSFRLVSITNDIAKLSTYNDYDPVDVPVRLMGVLQHFKGQPTKDAVSVIAEREKVTLDSELIRKLTDFALLVPAGQNGEAAAASAQAGNPQTAKTGRRGQKIILQN